MKEECPSGSDSDDVWRGFYEGHPYHNTNMTTWFVEKGGHVWQVEEHSSGSGHAEESPRRVDDRAVAYDNDWDADGS